MRAVAEGGAAASGYYYVVVVGGCTLLTVATLLLSHSSVTFLDPLREAGNRSDPHFNRGPGNPDPILVVREWPIGHSDATFSTEFLRLRRFFVFPGGRGDS